MLGRRYEKHVGRQLTPPLDSARATAVGPLLPRDIPVEGTNWRSSTLDIAIAGLGWVGVGLSGRGLLRVWVPEGVAVTTRRALMPDYARDLERPVRRRPPQTMMEDSSCRFVHSSSDDGNAAAGGGDDSSEADVNDGAAAAEAAASDDDDDDDDDDDADDGNDGDDVEEHHGFLVAPLEHILAQTCTKNFLDNNLGYVLGTTWGVDQVPE
eukprot:jgi/Botrbrau1/5471/Bobra.27_1s0021.1